MNPEYYSIEMALCGQKTPLDQDLSIQIITQCSGSPIIRKDGSISINQDDFWLIVDKLGQKIEEYKIDGRNTDNCPVIRRSL
ncbi:MAG: hypothetical protein KIH89_000275 [Candidatus Shapirobacteria bacterium]|nr:hypothetical protein [Candidatus Shapirobacteria bacterium]